MAHAPPPLLEWRVWFWPVLLALTALALGSQPAQAAVTGAWVHRYSNVVSNSNDLASKLVIDVVGDVIVTGTTHSEGLGRDMLTIKYSGASGSMLWQQRYNGPANLDDVPNAVAVDGNGNVVLSGSSKNAAQGGFSSVDYYTVKYATVDGALVWEKRQQAAGGYFQSGTAVVMDRRGNAVVTGLYQSTIFDELGVENGFVYDYHTAKYAAADGALLWEKRLNRPGTGFDYIAPAAALDGSGNVMITGYVNLETDGNFDPVIYTVKYSGENGGLIWEKFGPGGNGKVVAVDESGNVVVTGRSYNPSDDYYTAKYAAADGALLWEKRYNSPANLTDVPTAMVLDAVGNAVVTGYTQNGPPHSDLGYVTVKYAAADGAVLWEKRFDGPANGADGADAVAVDGSGNVVVTGYSFNKADNDYDYYTVKYAAADGALIWDKRYDGPANNRDLASGVAVDASGDVVVTGESLRKSGNSDFYTVKYAGATGAPRWEQRYDGNGMVNTSSYARAVAVDGGGDVVVTGYSDGGESGEDFYTAKYAGTDGALLWAKRYDGPANAVDQATAIAVDGSGNVVVTGWSHNGTRIDNYTAKYAVRDGGLLWEQRYTSADYDIAVMQAVAVDHDGNVIVTGITATLKYAAADGALLWKKPRDVYGSTFQLTVDGSNNVVVAGYTGIWWNRNSDYYTAKYAAVDGTLLWEQRFNGPSNLRDIATGLAVDGRGNVVVTGFSATSGSDDTGYTHDYFTVKYAATNGAVLWEKRYNGPANGNDEAYALAVDGDGNVVVTGNSSNGKNTDFYTLKYAAADGTLLWGKRYNSPADDHDYATAVAVDARGNVVVTGTSSAGGMGDYYTASYAPSDGALLWEKRYNGPAHGDDHVGNNRSLALGPNGMIVITGSSISPGPGPGPGSHATYDYATVVYRELPLPLAIDIIPTGVRLHFAGIPGCAYTIERASTVAGPWTTINTQIAPRSGLLEYVDAKPVAAAVFYRTTEL